MNWAYFHILVNHFPIIGFIIGTLILIAGMVLRNEGIKMSGLGTLVFAAGMAIVADFTGDPAKDAVKGIPDVAESLVNRHEDIASVALFIVIPAGLLAALTLYSLFRKEKSVRFLLPVTLVLSIISCVALGFVGRSGGQIRHTEFQNEATKQYMIEHQNDNVEED